MLAAALFLAFVGKHRLPIQSPPELDLAMVQYMTERFMMGHDLSDGTHSLIGLQHFMPRYARGGDMALPRSVRALKGWRRLAPPRSRVGVSVYVVSAIAARLVARGRLDMGARVVLAHGAYLRPSACMELRRMCIVPPVARTTENWTILLSASHFNLRSEMGASDDSVEWDVVEFKWFSDVLEALGHGQGSEKVWGYFYPELVK